MIRLSRVIRFCINPPGSGSTREALNGQAGKPPMQGLGRYYELEVQATGSPDPTTGYLINIKHLDQATRQHAIPIIEDACNHRPNTQPIDLLPDITRAISVALLPTNLERLRWRLTPYYSVEMVTNQPSTAIMRQQFDLAAAHRLHADTLSDKQNLEIFGRCNNPAGHGHNYRFEPAVALKLDNTANPFTLRDLEQLAHDTILERFDHKHLNLDTTEFGTQGVIPSVENIAKVFFDLLAPAVHDHSKGAATLRSMTVWETDRTSCSYPAE